MSDGATETIEAEEWSGAMGEKWLANLDRFEGMIAPVGSAFLDHAGFKACEHVVDIGCGGGGTTIAIARAVAPSGTALGVDISPALVAAARKRAEGIANIAFVNTDAATARPEGAPFDRLFSRFGSMFFADRPAAFANLRRMVRDGGRADFAVWAPAKENGWIAGMMESVSRHVTLPPPVPHAPGPFALDDPDYVRPLLLDAGFRTVDFTRWQGEQHIGGAGIRPAEAVDFVLGSLSFATTIAEQDEEVGRQVRDDLTALFARHQRGGSIVMEGAAWFVTATA